MPGLQRERRALVRYFLDASGTRIARQGTIDRNPAVADEPTTGVIVGRTYLYIANSQWDKHDDNGARVAGTPLPPALLLAVPLPH